MKTLLAVFSCHKYVYSAEGLRDWFVRPSGEDRVQSLRETWLNDVNIDYKIFYGRGGTNPKSDEVFLSAPDDYHHSAEKFRMLLRYALDYGYDRLIKVDDDVWVYWNRLKENIPTADYVGTGPSNFAAGFTYSLSKRAMEIVVKSPDGVFAEDRWAGESLRRAGIYLTREPRFHLVKPTRVNQYISDEDLLKPNDYLTIHSLSPTQMRRLYCHTRDASPAVPSAPVLI